MTPLELPAREAIPLPAPPTVRARPTSNGLRIVAASRPGAAQMVLRLAFPWGAAVDPPDALGAVHLMLRLLSEGTARYPDEAFLGAVDDAGLAWHTRLGHDTAVIDVVALPETWSVALELLAEAVQRPTFPQEAFERLRTEVTEELRARADDPAHVADDRLAEAALGAHPYGRLPQGRLDHLPRIPRDLVAALHGRWVRPAGAVLAVVGAIEPDEVGVAVERAFASWKGTPPPWRLPPLRRLRAAGRHLRVPWPGAAQAEIRLLRRGWAYGRPGWAATVVANHIFGGNTITGRLGARLREELGWTYGIRSYLQAWRLGGVWGVEAAVEGGRGSAALAEALDQAARLAAAGPSDDELEQAREAVVVGLLRGFETPAQLAGRLAMPLLHGLPADWWRRLVRRVRRVDAAAVRRAMAGWHPDRVVRLQVGE